MIDRLLARLPDRAMPLAGRLHRVAKRRFWGGVRHWRRVIAESEHWSAERHEEHQRARLRDMLEHAHANVPYYREAIGALGASPGELATPEGLRELTPLTKRDLQDRLEDLTAQGVPRGELEYQTTGGSTGIPVGFYLDRVDSLAAEWAFITDLWGRVGYADGDRVAVLGGEPVRGGGIAERRPYWNFLHLSSYHLTDEDIPRLLERMRRFRPAFVKGYPSSISLVARHMLAGGEAPPEGLRGVLCGSENLYDWQRADIERAFGRRAFGWYGQSERVVLAGECEHDRAPHVYPQYGYTELIDAEGRPVEEPGRVGEIVGTAFVTRSMPLIRYRTSDYAAYADGPCSRCGRSYPRFERIEGRLQEFVVTESGRPISMTAINMHTPIFDNVAQFRFVQDEPGRLTLRVVPKPSYRAGEDEERIRTELAPKLGHGIELAEVELVDEIPPTRTGKHSFLDQRLSIGFGDQG